MSGWTEAEKVSQYRTYDNDACMGKDCPSLSSLQLVTSGATLPSAGDVTVVFFWGKFNATQYQLNPLYSALEAECKGLKVLGVSVDPNLADVEKFIEDPKGTCSKEFKTTFALAWDEKKQLHTKFSACLQKSFMVCHAFLINQEGKIVWHQDHSQLGATVPMWIGQMRAAVVATLAGNPVPSVGSKVVAAEVEENDEEDDCGAMGSF